MGIALNPIHNLERSIYKNISREKTHNQNQREAYIAETDKITEDQSRAYEMQAMITVACVIVMVSFSVFAAMTDYRINQNQVVLNQLTPENKTSFINQLTPEQREGLINQLAPEGTIDLAIDKYSAILEETTNSLKITRDFCRIAEQAIPKLPEVTNFYSQSKLNQLQHVKQIKEMHLSHLNQERANSHTQSLLNDIKDMRRRQQQARTVAGS